MEEGKEKEDVNVQSIDTVDLKKLLEYESQIFRDTLQYDGLTVCAK